PRLPRRGRVVAAQTGKLLPRLAAVGRAEERRVLNPGVDRIRIGRGRLEMPHARELPRSWRAVVPEGRADGTLVRELVSHRLPRLAAIATALDQLPEPAAGLGGIQAIRIGRRSLEVVDLPAPEVRAADVPSLPGAVCRQHERALPCSDQDPYSAHPALLLTFR